MGVFAILATLSTTIMLASIVLAYLFSVYASCLHHLDDITWFFTEVQVGLPNVLNIFSIALFFLLCAIGVVLTHGPNWYGLLCSFIWIGTMLLLLGYYCMLQGKLRARWRSQEWKDEHIRGRHGAAPTIGC